MNAAKILLLNDYSFKIGKSLNKTILMGIILTMMVTGSCAAPQTPDTKLYGKVSSYSK
jgi:hypothetical protein